MNLIFSQKKIPFQNASSKICYLELLTFDKVEGEDAAVCNTCESKLLCKGGTTTVLINHLKISSHKEAFKQYNYMKERENRKRPSSSSQANATPAKQFLHN